MTTVRKVLGRLPMLIGDWDSNYREGQGYLKNNRVLIFNSELQSKIDNNTYAPATQNAQTGVITFDTTHWTVISDGRETIGLGTASKKDVPSSGNASTTQVVMGNDTRLSDARTANGGNSATVNGHTVLSDVPAKALFTDTDTKVTSVDNHYQQTTKPTQTTSGLYKMKIDAAGHITESVAVQKSDITSLGIPSDDTHHDGSVTAISGHALTKVQVDSDGTWSKEDVAIPTKSDFTGSIESGNTGFVTGGDAYTSLADKADLVNGVVPADQLPSFVDDIVELLKMDSTAPATCSKGDYYYNTSTKKIVRATGTNTWGTGITTNTDPEKSKIYFDKNEQKSYRWSGSAMLEIHDTLSIGTSAGTAADGKVVNDHITNTSNPHNVTAAQIGAVSTEANQGLTDTEKSNARANIGLGNVANTGDSATPVKDGTTKFTTGGAYTELDKKVDKVTGKGLSTNDYDDTAKGKVDNIPSSPKYTDTTYQFEQSGNTLKMGTNNGTKSNIYTPSVPSVASTSSLLKGDGNGNAVAATEGTDYQAPLSFKTTPSSSNKVVTESDITNGDAKTSKRILPMATLNNLGAGLTVGEVKTWIANQFNGEGSIGDCVSVSDDVITHWDTENHVVNSGSAYSFMKISGGYSGYYYGQYIISSYNLEPVGIVGRNDGQWSSIKWIAVSDQINGCVPKKSNRHYYPFIAASELGTATGIFKVTLPRQSAGEMVWDMITMEIVLGGAHERRADGRIYLNYYFFQGQNGWVERSVKALAFGMHLYSENITICYDIADPMTFYITTVQSDYNGIAIENLSAWDNAKDLDFLTTTIEPVSSLPASASSTVPMDILDITNGGDLKFNGNAIIHAGNIGSQSVNYATSAGKASNIISNYYSVSSNQANIATSLTVDGCENKIYYNSGSSDITLAITTSTDVIAVDGNTSLTLGAGKYAEINFIRKTISGTAKIFIRSVSQ